MHRSNLRISRMKCKVCGSNAKQVLDLGLQAPSNQYLELNNLEKETIKPLDLYYCSNCYHAFVPAYFSSEELFTPNYAYLSSKSLSWLSHAKDLAANSTNLLDLGPNSKILEIASNDGYFLKNFLDTDMTIVGIEPTLSAATRSLDLGIDTRIRFFNSLYAQELVHEFGHFNYVVANNVIAHVPDILDFVSGINTLIGDIGVASIEFAHLLSLLKNSEFDTIYHEHYSYLSLISLEYIFQSCGLIVFNAEKLKTHGGSLRVWIKSVKNKKFKKQETVELIKKQESEACLDKYCAFDNLSEQANHIKISLTNFLEDCRNRKEIVHAYGAAAKGNTLLNYCKVNSDMIQFVYDASEEKQNKYLPMSHIPILSPNSPQLLNADHIIILPWNLKDEIKSLINTKFSDAGKIKPAIYTPIPTFERLQ